MPTTALVTSGQYLNLPDEFDASGNRIKDELIGGEIVKTPPASLLHDRIKSLISRLLMRYLDANPQIAMEVLVEAGAQVSNQDVFVPDISIVRRERLTGNARILQGPPDIAIEVVSSSDTASHLKAKVDAYLANGSQAVCVVYPESKSVIVHAAGAMRELKGDSNIEATALAGFSARVSTFFEVQ